MPVISGYSPNLGLTLYTTSTSPPDVWGAGTNTNIGTLLEQAISGYNTYTFTADADETIGSITDGESALARNMVINLLSSVNLTATRNLTLPTNSKIYFISNNTLNGQSIVLTTGSGSTVTVTNGVTVAVVSDGAGNIIALNTAGSAGGTSGELQYNSSGAFAGLPNSSVSGNTLTIGSLNVTPNAYPATGYTTVAEDAGKLFLVATPNTYNVAANSSVPYPVGTVLTFLNTSYISTPPNQCLIACTDTFRSGASSGTGGLYLRNSTWLVLTKTAATEWWYQFYPYPGAGTTNQILTFDDSGAGGGPGTTFNGSLAETVSYNTIGAIGTGSFTGSNQSLTTNGYQKLPGGLVMQWGTETGYTTGSATGSVTFPIAFPTACLNVTATGWGYGNASGQASATINGVSIYESSGTIPTTGFNWIMQNLANLNGFYWFAIGY